MNRKLRFIVAIAASLVTQFTVVAQESQTWQRLAPEGETFSVMMPTPISQETKTNPDDARMKLRLYTSESESKFFNISSLDISGRFQPTIPNFESFIKGFLQSYCAPSRQKGLSCETVFERELKLNGHPGKQFRVTIASGERSIEGVLRIYMTGKNFYSIQAIGGREGDAQIDKFLKSFTLAEAQPVPRL